MPISSIVAKSNTSLTVRYSITNDSLDNARHIENIFSRIQSKLPELYTFKLRASDGAVWKYGVFKNGRSVGGVYVKFASRDFVIYDVIFFWDNNDFNRPVPFTMVNWG